MSVREAPELSTEGPGWAALFWEAFVRSKNAMVLLDDHRRHVEVNGAYLALLGYRRGDMVGRPAYEFVVGGPMVTASEWQAVLDRDHFTGKTDLICADGGHVTVEFAGHPEVVTGRHLVLFVAIRATRSGRRHHDVTPPRSDCVALSKRELEVVQLVALGMSGPEVAAELHLAHNTVRTHVRNAMSKVGARSRAQLVARTLGEGLHWQVGER